MKPVRPMVDGAAHKNTNAQLVSLRSERRILLQLPWLQSIWVDEAKTDAIDDHKRVFRDRLPCQTVSIQLVGSMQFTRYSQYGPS